MKSTCGCASYAEGRKPTSVAPYHLRVSRPYQSEKSALLMHAKDKQENNFSLKNFSSKKGFHTKLEARGIPLIEKYLTITFGLNVLLLNFSFFIFRKTHCTYKRFHVIEEEIIRSRLNCPP